MRISFTTIVLKECHETIELRIAFFRGAKKSTSHFPTVKEPASASGEPDDCLS